MKNTTVKIMSFPNPSIFNAYLTLFYESLAKHGIQRVDSTYIGKHFINGKVVYSNMNRDFNDPKIWASFNFPPRNLTDFMTCNGEMKAKFIKRKARSVAKKLVSKVAIIK